jgi:hypothetical protein
MNVSLRETLVWCSVRRYVRDTAGRVVREVDRRIELYDYPIKLGGRFRDRRLRELAFVDAEGVQIAVNHYIRPTLRRGYGLTRKLQKAQAS